MIITTSDFVVVVVNTIPVTMIFAVSRKVIFNQSLFLLFFAQFSSGYDEIWFVAEAGQPEDSDTFFSLWNVFAR